MRIRLIVSLRSGLRKFKQMITGTLEKKLVVSEVIVAQRTSSTYGDTAAEELKLFLQGMKENAACDVVTQVSP